jgi:hypothetical protein
MAGEASRRIINTWSFNEDLEGIKLVLERLEISQASPG